VTLWIDNQLPPALASWMGATFSIDCLPVRDLNLHRATDTDFVELLEKHGPPPQVVLVTCGNTSNARLRGLVQMAWPAVVTMLERGEALVELGDQFDRVP
jgi:predicted nuclease of predicted toxin-antitoxin system